MAVRFGHLLRPIKSRIEDFSNTHLKPMSGPNGSRSLSRTEHHRDKFGTDFVRYTPDGPWIMLGPPNTSSVQLPSAYGASLPPDSRLPSFRDMFSTVDLSFPGANGQVRDPHDLRNPSGLQGHVSDKLTQVPTPLAMRSHGNMDPSQVRLPDDNENDFPPAHVLLKNMAEPASRVAGCRHSDSKGKGKRRSASSPIPSSLKLPPKRHKVSAVESSASTLQKKRGRKEGSGNYTTDDLDALMDILEERLPIGGKGWNTSTDDFNEWARENG